MIADQKKKPSAGFWITVALVVGLVAYPLSFGPACWLSQDESIPEPMEDLFIVYKPMVWALDSHHSPRWLRRTVDWYVGLWVGP